MSGSREEAKKIFLRDIEELTKTNDPTKDKAFTRWICQEFIPGLEDEKDIDEAISIGSSGDGGIDIFFHREDVDRTEQYLCWVQAKYGEKLDYEVKNDELEYFAGSISRLENSESLANTNYMFKEAGKKFRDLKRGGSITMKMIFVVAGKLNGQAQKNYEDEVWKNMKIDPDIKLEVIDIDNILDQIVTKETQDMTIEFDEEHTCPVITRTDVVSKKQSIVGYIKAKEIVKCLKKDKNIFLLNPRESLGRGTVVNKKIQQTLRNDERKKKFWKLNNGITAVCDKLKEVNASPPKYEFENFKIVNGRQTTYSFEKNVAHLTDEVLVKIIIHEAVDKEERNLISETTNTQNPVKAVDLVSDNDLLWELVQQCKLEWSEFWFDRQTKGYKNNATSSTTARVTSRRLMLKEATARAYYAYEISPYEALDLSEQDMFSSVNTTYFDNVFKGRKMKELVIPHIFMNCISVLEGEWRTELLSNNTKYERDYQIIKKKIVKYYILYFIHDTLDKIQPSDKDKIEKKIIEVFRNLTKNDPLPQDFVDIANVALLQFIIAYNADKQLMWPLDEHGTIREPTPDEIMKMLKSGKSGSGGFTAESIVKTFNVGFQ